MSDKIEKECVVFGIVYVPKENSRLSFLQAGSVNSLEDLAGVWYAENHPFPEIFHDENAYRALKRKIVPGEDSLDVSKAIQQTPVNIPFKPFSIENFYEVHTDDKEGIISALALATWDLVFEEKGVYTFTIGYKTPFGLSRFNPNNLSEDMSIYGQKKTVEVVQAVLRNQDGSFEVIKPFLAYALNTSDEPLFQDHFEIFNHYPTVATNLESIPNKMRDEIFSLHEQSMVRCHDFSRHEKGYVRIGSHAPYAHSAWDVITHNK